MKIPSSAISPLLLSSILACASLIGCEGTPATDAGTSPTATDGGTDNTEADGGTDNNNTDSGTNNTDSGTDNTEADGGTDNNNTDGGTPPPDVVLPPANPQAACANPQVLTLGENSGTTIGQPNNFQAECVGEDAPDALFTYTPTQTDIILNVSVLNTTEGADLGLYMRTSCDAIEEIACKDSSIAGATDSISVSGINAGQTVFIYVDGYRGDDIGDFTLSVYETTLLDSGADCTPDNPEAICGTEGDACLSDGDDTFSCKNPITTKCNEAETLQLGANELTFAEDTTNVFSGACIGFRDAEQVYRYTVIGERVNVVATSPEGTTNILGGHTRSTCSDEDSELACFSTARGGSNKALDLSTGDEIILFIEGEAGAFTLNITEEPIATLAAGAVCDTTSDTAFCDENITDLECLQVDDVSTCQVQEVLERGISCNPDDTGRVCDTAQRDTCLDDGTGNGTSACLNPLFDKCDAGPTAFANGTATASAATNATEGSCSFTYEEAIFSYTVIGDRVNVTFTGNEEVRNIYARNTCDNPDEQVFCSRTADDAVLTDVSAGDVFFIFAEIDAADGAIDAVLTAVETPIALLAEGAACEKADINNICDSARDFACVGESLSGICTDVGMPNDVCADATPLGSTSGTVTGYLQAMNNDYNAKELGDCLISSTGNSTYPSNGNDVVYSINLQVGETIQLTALTERDTSIYILDSCPASATSCLAGADSTFSGTPEELSFTATETGTYFIIIDTYNNSGDAFSLEWNVQ